VRELSIEDLPGDVLPNCDSYHMMGSHCTLNKIGVLSVLVGHPLDLVKVRMQTGKVKEGRKQGTFAILRQVVEREGFGGLYRGVSAPIVAVAPIWATSFWGFDTGIKLVRAFCNLGPGVALTLPQLCIAGGFSALPTALVMVNPDIFCIQHSYCDRVPLIL
jgi:hypothetical protein